MRSLRLVPIQYACVHVRSLSHVQLFMTPWTAACLAPVGFSRQEYWSGLPFPSWEDLPSLELEPESPVCPALAGGFLPLHHLGNPSIWLVYLSSGDYGTRKYPGKPMWSIRRKGQSTSQGKRPRRNQLCWYGPWTSSLQSCEKIHL